MVLKRWDRVRLQTDQGQWVEAIAPVIISASRATDIPAFHAEWFMNRLRRGYIRWHNPFHANQSQYVAFDKVRVIVFWTKNPEPMLPYIEELADRGLHFYFTYTLNDYTAENFEPNVPALQQRIEVFQRLSEKIGKARVIWRFDPLILTAQLDVDILLARIQSIGDELHAYTEKLVISFADIDVYPAVQNNLRRLGIAVCPFDEAAVRKIAQGLQKLNQQWKLTLAACGKVVDLSAYGIIPNRCIDDELMIRCFPEDEALMEFLGVAKFESMDLFATGWPGNRPNLKDLGQRRACGCIMSKDIGQYDTCPHFCVYCYANHSADRVRHNLRRLHTWDDGLLWT